MYFAPLLGLFLLLSSLVMFLCSVGIFQRAQVPGAPAFDPSSVASSSREDPELAHLQAELAHMGEMLRARDEELAVFRSTHEQAGLHTSSPSPPVIPPAGPESQEIPQSAPAPPPDSIPEPASDPSSSETVARLLRERDDWVRERAELGERIRVLEEVRHSGLPETSDRSLHDAEFELMMERRMTDMRVRSAEQVVEARMDTIRVRLQAELDAARTEARRLQDQLTGSRESAGAFIQRMVGPGSQVEGSIGVDPRTTSGRVWDYVQCDMDL
eukprot:TRINITY_DN6474_c0_g1_i10.p1 TRINITY_DN6474_c0_g1~~TRINITY_DN6474_c0_g1_i10.p1  ORF type:complete len:271 (-),score=31.50 TRINITY_DN6474_c0_g1_i10:298-1110(-)